MWREPGYLSQCSVWLRFDPRQRQEDFSSNFYVQTGSEAHPASYPMGAWVLSPGVKRGQVVTLTTHSI
jgi:hypothetical protein